MRIGEVITEYRESHGMSQRAFARRSGLSNAQIALLERGIGNSGKPFEPTFDTVRKVARAMGTTPEALISECDDFMLTLKDRDTTAEIIKDIYATFLQTGNVTRTAEALQARHGISMAISNLSRTIKNPIYKGEFRGVPFCEPIIPPEDWDRAQRIGRTLIHKSKHDYIFSGITYCGICGEKMRWNFPERGKKQARCLNHWNTISEAEMERQVIEQVEPELNRYRIELSNRPKQTKLKQRYEDKLNRLTDLYVDGVITREEFNERRAETQALLKEVEDPPVPDLPLNWKDLYNELTDVQKNVLWKSTVDHFTVKDKTVSIAFETAKVLAERMAILSEPPKESF